MIWAGVKLACEKTVQWFQFNDLFSRFRLGYPVQKAAFVVIADGEGEMAGFLVQWNAQWQTYNLVGGKLDNGRGDGNRLLRTIKRELTEELHLEGEEDVRVCRQFQPLRMKQFSRREKILKWYKFGVFYVTLYPYKSDLYRRWAFSRLKSRNNRFVSQVEICQQQTWDGKPISPTTRYILCKLELLTACVSECSDCVLS